MFDIHCHILPGVDDGAKDMEQSMRMIRTAYESGIRDFILTPHYKEGRHNASVPTIRRRLEEVRREAGKRGMKVSLYAGNEILYSGEAAERLEEGRALSLAGSRYVLIEFYPAHPFPYIRNALDEIGGMGYEPVLAHAERYECLLKDWENVRELKELNVGIQVNAASITGALGFGVKRFTDRLLKERLVDYVGTDAHDDGKRSPDVRKCLSCLYRKYDPAYVDAVCYGNAKRIVNDNEQG